MYKATEPMARQHALRRSSSIPPCKDAEYELFDVLAEDHDADEQRAPENQEMLKKLRRAHSPPGSTS